jgi:hypothetical protein
MKLRIVSMVGLSLLFASAVAAQTKVAGKMQCPKPEVVGTVEAGDQAGHRLTLEKNTCPWSTPMEMQGENRRMEPTLRSQKTAPREPQPVELTSAIWRAAISSSSASIGPS